MEAADQKAMELILEMGVATQEQIDDAIHVRERMLEMGMQPRSVAEILFEKGHIEREEFEEIRRKERRFQGQEQIAGYRLLERLGEGAMGTVYKARQLSLDREVAIKVLAPDLAKDDAYVERFMKEARAVARLNHTNVISGIDVGDADGIKYMVMEFADGMTVASLLRRGGSLDEERALRIGAQMARALDHAHRNHLVHRDVKPDNIIITGDGVAKLCDLGLARIESGTDDSTRMGTPAYMSPELARHDTAVDERTDLYSLGATLFHMVTGREPYTGKDGPSVMAKHLTEPVPNATEVEPSVSLETSALIAQLMAKQAVERIATAKELLDLLEERLRALQGARGVAASRASGGASAPVSARPSQPSSAPPSGGSAPVSRRRRRRR
ncbi:MAG: serine/threonine-protein kinase [Planctomycetota bacterium]|nr:serine/threonine-protein kinase [Planctomycetota bacterium]